MHASNACAVNVNTRARKERQEYAGSPRRLSKYKKEDEVTTDMIL